MDGSQDWNTIIFPDWINLINILLPRKLFQSIVKVSRINLYLYKPAFIKAGFAKASVYFQLTHTKFPYSADLMCTLLLLHWISTQYINSTQLLDQCTRTINTNTKYSNQEILLGLTILINKYTPTNTWSYKSWLYTESKWTVQNKQYCFLAMHDLPSDVPRALTQANTLLWAFALHFVWTQILAHNKTTDQFVCQFVIRK